MRFKRVRKYRGGALGEMSNAINALEDSMEKIRAGDGITLIKENNSIAILATPYRRSGSGLAVAGTPALFKVCALVGWKKTSAEAEWEKMSLKEMIEENPTRLWTEFKDGENSYPWKALRPTWDYVRGWEEET